MRYSLIEADRTPVSLSLHDLWERAETLPDRYGLTQGSVAQSDAARPRSAGATTSRRRRDPGRVGADGQRGRALSRLVQEQGDGDAADRFGAQHRLQPARGERGEKRQPSGPNACLPRGDRRRRAGHGISCLQRFEAAGRVSLGELLLWRPARRPGGARVVRAWRVSRPTASPATLNGGAGRPCSGCRPAACSQRSPASDCLARSVKPGCSIFAATSKTPPCTCP